MACLDEQMGHERCGACIACLRARIAELEEALRSVRACAADQRWMHDRNGEGRDLAVIGRLLAIDATCTDALKGGE